MTDGVYFSANNAMLPWAIPFLNSFRTHNPSLPLSLIPFDESSDEIIALSERFGFSVYSDGSFARLETIGAALELGHAPYGKYWFRRYSSFWGPFENFVYLDVRQVVLSDLSPFLEAPQKFGYDLVFIDSELNQVYNPGQIRQKFLRSGGGKGFNSGRWASYRDLFDLTDFERSLTEQIKVRNQLNARNTDQAFINFCCDERELRLAKLSDLLDDIIDTGWARLQGTPYLDGSGVWRLWDHGGNNHKKRIVLMHWAGYVAGDPLPHNSLLKRFGPSIPVNKVKSIRRKMAGSRIVRRLLGK